MALRMMEITVPERNGEQVAQLVAAAETVDSWQGPLRDELLLTRVLLDAGRVEPLLNRIVESCSSADRFRVVLLEAEATLPKMEEPEPEPASEQAAAQPKEADPVRLATAELVARLDPAAVMDRTFLATVVLSTMVAAIGLMRDNMAVLVGAMVIAPLLTPNMALALATTLGDGKLLRGALRVNVVGVSLSFLLSILLGVTIPFDVDAAEVVSRTIIGPADLVLALAAGSAGALAFTTGVSASLVGVMVAVALLPPLVCAGMLIGAGEAALGVRALLLVAANVICVNLAGVSTFLLKRVRPGFWWEAARARRMLRAAGLVWLLLLLLLLLVLYLSRS